jgi:serine/threonine-protein kinase
VATSRIAEHVGRVLGGRYRLIRPVGTGGSAHVYVAEDVTLRRRVAVKLLHSALAGDVAFLRRFQAEARVVAALRHPNIVRVYDWGEDDGAPYLVMELLEGGSLRTLLDSGDRLTPAQAALLGADVARGLDYAHRRGLVHRDIKPANLLFDEEGRVCIADFGVARALADATWTEPAGAVLGTARYAAPEQVQGASLDGKADVYALALVLVEAVTGAVPFAADTTIATLMGRLDRPIPVPDELGPLATVLGRAGRPDPADRPDAQALATALEAAASDLPVGPPLRVGGHAGGDVEDDADITELAGRPVLFDGQAGAEGTGAGEPAGAGFVLTADRWPAEPSATSSAWAAGAVPAAEPAAASAVGTAPVGTAPGAPPRRRRLRWVALAVLVLAAIGAGGLVVARALRPTHPVPDLQGQTVAAARAALHPLRLHLKVAGEVYDEHHAKGTIAGQRPAPSRSVTEGSTVSVDLSAGMPPVAVPDLTGLTADQAGQRLIGAGLAVGTTVTRPDDTVPAGIVVSWTGQGGQLPKGSLVNLVVSTGKPQVAVPDVRGGSFTQAQAALASVGLVAVEDDQFNDAPAGQVVGTTPAPGAAAVVGSQVTVTVSKGPDLVTVPNVGRQSVQAATAAIEGAGLTVNEVVGSPDRPVHVTDPPAGSRVKRGSAVRLYTS